MQFTVMISKTAGILMVKHGISSAVVEDMLMSSYDILADRNEDHFAMIYDKENKVGALILVKRIIPKIVATVWFVFRGSQMYIGSLRGNNTLANTLLAQSTKK